MEKQKKLNETERAVPFCIRLADTVIRIEPMFDYMKEYCLKYITEEQESFTVRVEPTDIAFERERSAKEAEREVRVDAVYSDDYLETLAVYRKIAERMPVYDTLLFHGSVIAVDSVGYLFTAKSGIHYDVCAAAEACVYPDSGRCSLCGDYTDFA